MKTIHKHGFKIIIFTLLIAAAFAAGCGTLKRFRRGEETTGPGMSGGTPLQKVKLGVDVLIEERIDIVAGKRVGLITNPSGVNMNLESTIDVLHRHPQVSLLKLFAPEHGIRGDIEAGKPVESYTDPVTGLPVFSLYGSARKPTQDMLWGLDILLFDIQDVGVRPYTYIYTMAYAMEAAKEAGIEFCVLDRPNPLGGKLVEGAVLDPEFKSFIGLYPIPYVHGMTAGELAWFFNREFGVGADLQVVPMSGWTRDMTWEDTGLKWVATSPHVPEASTVPYFATTGCMGELGTISEGVGYTMPFKLAGAPWINANELAEELNGRNLPGITFRPVHWTQFYGTFKGQQLGGVQLHINDFSVYKPFATGLHIIEAVHSLYPDQDIFPENRQSSFNRAAGTDEILTKLKAGVTAEIIIESYTPELDAFLILRQEYLLYR